MEFMFGPRFLLLRLWSMVRKHPQPEWDGQSYQLFAEHWLPHESGQRRFKLSRVTPRSQITIILIGCKSREPWKRSSPGFWIEKHKLLK